MGLESFQPRRCLYRGATPRLIVPPAFSVDTVLYEEQVVRAVGSRVTRSEASEIEVDAVGFLRRIEGSASDAGAADIGTVKGNMA